MLNHMNLISIIPLVRSLHLKNYPELISAVKNPGGMMEDTEGFYDPCPKASLNRFARMVAIDPNLPL
ncbi:hypothetical protein [Pseudomonas mosselii]|uniref:hypothetical protein n=1 Tax=Pseudomonas mosselii TaxID=78327 RepID=UPI00117AC5C8|nr:hypothetical protein [Pseudomonas mosselii]